MRNIRRIYLVTSLDEQTLVLPKEHRFLSCGGLEVADDFDHILLWMEAPAEQSETVHVTFFLRRGGVPFEEPEGGHQYVGTALAWHVYASNVCATGAKETQPEEWNRDHPVGTKVRYWAMEREGEPTGEGVTTGIAYRLCGTPVVPIRRWPDGSFGPYAITHVEALEDAPTRCDECDPSFGCFSAPERCCKKPREEKE